MKLVASTHLFHIVLFLWQTDFPCRGRSYLSNFLLSGAAQAGKKTLAEMLGGSIRQTQIKAEPPRPRLCTPGQGFSFKTSILRIPLPSPGLAPLWNSHTWPSAYSLRCRGESMNSREAAPDESPGEVMLASNLLTAAEYLSASPWDSVELLGIALLRIPAWAPAWWGKGLSRLSWILTKSTPS